MKVRVDLDLCQGHGTCAGEAPEVFALEGDEVKVLTPEPPSEQHEAVRLAVKYCPTRALSIQED